MSFKSCQFLFAISFETFHIAYLFFFNLKRLIIAMGRFWYRYQNLKKSCTYPNVVIT